MVAAASLATNSTSSTSEGNLTCRICGEILSSSKIEQELHELMHVNDILKVCSLCNKSFFNVDEYGLHMEQHFEDDVKYRCEDCGASFSFKHHLSRHSCPRVDPSDI